MEMTHVRPGATKQELDKDTLKMTDTKQRALAYRPFLAISGVHILLTTATLVMVAAIIAKPDLIFGEADTTEPSLLEKFPGYFRTNETEHELEVDINNASISVNDAELTTGTVTHHACCVTNVRFTSPSTAKDISGITRNLAVFTSSNNKAYRQYFRQESCDQVSTCNSCTCRTQDAISNAVYDKGSSYSPAQRYTVGWFKFHACCRCIN